jgi:hypothetical protein
MGRWRVWLVSVVVVLGLLAVACWFARSAMVAACHMDRDGAGACVFTNGSPVPTRVCAQVNVGLVGNELSAKGKAIMAKIDAGTATPDEIERGTELAARAQNLAVGLKTGELTADPVTGALTIRKKGPVRSTLCSGLVWPHSSVSLPFNIAAVSSMCNRGPGSVLEWGDICSFSFATK